MGLFDRVKIDDRLDLKLKKVDAMSIHKASEGDNKWKHDLQTKDLENWMQDFSIDSKGKLWIYEDPKDKRKRKKYPHTGDIEVYTIITNDSSEYDVDVNVELTFDKGIGKVKQTTVRRSPNDTRLKNEKQFEENRKRYDALRQTTRYKIYKTLYKCPVSWTLYGLSKMFYSLSHAMQRLRYKLLFW